MVALIITTSIVALAMIIGYSSSFFLGDDNKIEQQCEDVIYQETGKDVDLTPGSPEIPPSQRLKTTPNDTQGV